MALRSDGYHFVNTFITYKNRGPSSGWRPGNEKWTVVRHRPRVQAWGATTHPSGSVQHVIREQFVGTHVSGYVVKVTVWACTKRCLSPITTNEAFLPERRCKTCARYKGKRRS